MIQSLYDRPFPTNAFSSFGLTIIDEVHRIGSEEFSKTLFKTITNYMLGISATVDRKDGLTNVLHMFIGPKIYSEERKDEDIVEVRAIEYANANEEYNEVVYDYMGNVQHTTMISKISKFQPRCDFLVRVLKDLMRENSDKQIMVLSQIRGLLTLIHEQLHEHYDVGFYVGGMKKEDLQATEEKQIVLATYAMAAEALDIKTLNTLVMVSPKTDIIQSVGRILRTRAEGKLIVDIVDTHTVFQNQWKKRRVYYKKCGYGIQYIKSPEYVDMQNSIWKRIANPVLQSNNSKPICITEGEGEGEGEDDEDIEKHTCLIDVSQYNFDQALF
jgi:superfamily II DNA or RNA helicase